MVSGEDRCLTISKTFASTFLIELSDTFLCYGNGTARPALATRKCAAAQSYYRGTGL